MDVEFIQIEGQQGGWQLLFQKLHQISRVNAGPQLIGKKPMNVIRNRYRDVLPMDLTRVTLDDPDNDYINANHVQFDEAQRKYILTQGPLEHTCPHFWQMVWENKSYGIVMLNKCVERGMSKCYPYWPHAEDPPLEVGKFRIESLGTDEEPSYQLSNLKLQNTETDESRVILHFHYTKWPDFGVPQNPDVFLEFLYAVRGSGVLGGASDSVGVGPCVVHCSAGIGRTGTFCLVDIMLAKLESCGELGGVNAQSVLLNMRRQRLGLIQTPDQLRFSYISILQGAIQDLHLETSSYEPEMSDSEEDSLEDSDSEEDEDERMERKYPSLNRQYGTEDSRTHDVDDVPPPLPPRPPDTLPHTFTPSESDEDSDDAYEKPPPPPSSKPPGPPTLPPGPPASTPIDEGQMSKRRRLNDDVEPPPPVPPRNQSLSPSPAHDNGRMDIYSEPFLGEGRGDSPPPLPAKNKAKQTTDIEEEEKALISELDELERLVSRDTIPNGDLQTTRSGERESRRERTMSKIQSIKEQMRESEQESEWSVPWLLVGFVAVLGYFVYYALR